MKSTTSNMIQASIAWVAVGVCVTFGLYATNNANCLWAFCIPSWITYSANKNKEE